MRRSGSLLLVCGAALLAGCAKEPVAAEDEQISPPAPNPYLRSLDIALGGWQQLAAENDNSYRYVVNAGSVLGGPGYNTTLTVQEGEVIQRDLEITEIDDAGNVTVVESWSETGAAVGSHDEGAEPITIGGRFETCKKEVGRPDINAYDVDLSYVAATNVDPASTAPKNVLSECFVLPKGAIYDGGAEVVTSLEFLKND